MSHELRIPLFPLQTVLFPGSSLPLHIFEQRYRTLIREVRASRGEFGINYADGTNLSAVGCTATVREVVREYDDGRLDIIVLGGRRYRLQNYDAEEAVYLVGTVQILRGTGEHVDEALADETTVLYNHLMRKVYGDDRHCVDRPAGDPGISFVLAQKAGLDLHMRQKLLETETENARLGILKRYLTEVLPRIGEVEQIERVMRNDGYLSREETQ